MIRSRRRDLAAAHRSTLIPGTGEVSIPISSYRNIAADHVVFLVFSDNMPGRERRPEDPPALLQASGLRHPSLFHVERPVRLSKWLPTGGQGGEDQLAMQWRHLLDEARQTLGVQFGGGIVQQ